MATTIAWLVVAGAPERAALAQSFSCDLQRADQAETRIDEIKTWPDLRGWFAAYAGCDDGGIAEELDEFVTVLLATRWEDVPQLEQLSIDDPLFRRFVLEHVGRTANDLDTRAVVSNAITRCPGGLQDFCLDFVSLDAYRSQEERELGRSDASIPKNAAEDPRLPLPRTPPRGFVALPGAAAVPSPRGGLTVTYAERSPRSSREANLHALTLRNRSGRELWSYEFSKRVTVGWSPDGRSLAVTDWAKDIAATFVVAVHQDDSVEVCDLFVEVLSQVRDHRFLDNAHLYLEALRWRSPTTLSFQVRGYGDRHPRGFKRTFTYRVGRGVAR